MRDSGIFDAHLHVIDPRFPLVSNEGYLPEPFTARDYWARAGPLGVVGGAVVSGSFQAFDTSYLLDALGVLGPSFVGVAQLPALVTDEEVLRLHDAGVRAVRFNIKRGGSESPGSIERLAKRVYEISGWHAELYASSEELEDLEGMLRRLPSISIDHLGLSKTGRGTLLRMVERGSRVKATGFGRLDFDPVTAMREISTTNPDALMFGTDLPSTRADRPFRDGDVETVVEALGEDLARKALHDNASAFYRPVAVRSG